MQCIDALRSILLHEYMDISIRGQSLLLFDGVGLSIKVNPYAYCIASWTANFLFLL
jgi:hypothetical protein